MLDLGDVATDFDDVVVPDAAVVDAKNVLNCSDFEELTGLDMNAIIAHAAIYNGKCETLLNIDPIEHAAFSHFADLGLNYRQASRGKAAGRPWLLGFLKYLNYTPSVGCDQKKLNDILTEMGNSKGITARSAYNEIDISIYQQSSDATLPSGSDETEARENRSGLRHAPISGVFLVISRWRHFEKVYFLIETLLVPIHGNEVWLFACDDGIYVGEFCLGARSHSLEISLKGKEEWNNARSFTMHVDLANDAKEPFFEGVSTRTFKRGAPQLSSFYLVELLAEDADHSSVVDVIDDFKNSKRKNASKKFSERLSDLNDPDFKKLERLFPKSLDERLLPWEVEDGLRDIARLTASHWSALFNPNQLSLPHLSVVN